MFTIILITKSICDQDSTPWCKQTEIIWNVKKHTTLCCSTQLYLYNYTNVQVSAQCNFKSGVLIRRKKFRWEITNSRGLFQGTLHVRTYIYCTSIWYGFECTMFINHMELFVNHNCLHMNTSNTRENVLHPGQHYN